jgi:hypothetical protein
MGRIARWRKYHCRGPAQREGNFRQVLLLHESEVSSGLIGCR